MLFEQLSGNRIRIGMPNRYAAQKLVISAQFGEWKSRRAVAPAICCRVSSGVETGDSAGSMNRGPELLTQTPLEELTALPRLPAGREYPTPAVSLRASSFGSSGLATEGP